MAGQVEGAAPKLEAAQHRGLGGIAADREPPADLGIEPTAAHEDRLRRLDLEVKTHPRSGPLGWGATG